MATFFRCENLITYSTASVQIRAIQLININDDYDNSAHKPNGKEEAK